MAKKKICISVDEDLEKAVREFAKKEERSQVWVYEKAVREFLEKNK